MTMITPYVYVKLEEYAANTNPFNRSVIETHLKNARAGKPVKLSPALAKKVDTWMKSDDATREYTDPRDCIRNVYGVGEVMAAKLNTAGVHTITELQKYVADPACPLKLSPARLAAIRYAKELNERIDACVIRRFAATLPPWMTIVGSYRRGATTSGDVDIAVTDHWDEAPKYIKSLSQLTDGAHSKSFIADIGVIAHVDLFRIDTANLGSALIHHTGPMDFNINLRNYVKKWLIRQGSTCDVRTSQNGIVGIDIPINNTSEAAFFHSIDLPYIPPEQRDGFVGL